MKKRQSEEELLKEAEWAGTHIPDQEVPPPTPGGFEKLLKRVEQEREKTEHMKRDSGEAGKGGKR